MLFSRWVLWVLVNKHCSLNTPHINCCSLSTTHDEFCKVIISDGEYSTQWGMFTESYSRRVSRVHSVHCSQSTTDSDIVHWVLLTVRIVHKVYYSQWELFTEYYSQWQLFTKYTTQVIIVHRVPLTVTLFTVHYSH